MLELWATNNIIVGIGYRVTALIVSKIIDYIYNKYRNIKYRNIILKDIVALPNSKFNLISMPIMLKRR